MKYIAYLKELWWHKQFKASEQVCPGGLCALRQGKGCRTCVGGDKWRHGWSFPYYQIAHGHWLSLHIPHDHSHKICWFCNPYGTEQHRSFLWVYSQFSQKANLSRLMYTYQQLNCMILCNSCLDSSHKHSHSSSFLLQRRGLRHRNKQSSHRQEAEGPDSRLLVFSVCASEHCAFPSLSHFYYTSPAEGTFAQGAQTWRSGV